MISVVSIFIDWITWPDTRRLSGVILNPFLLKQEIQHEYPFKEYMASRPGVVLQNTQSIDDIRIKESRDPFLLFTGKK